MIYLIQIKNSFNWTAAGPLAASVPFHTGLDVREFKLRYSNPLDRWGGFPAQYYSPRGKRLASSSVFRSIWLRIYRSDAARRGW